MFSTIHRISGLRGPETPVVTPETPVHTGDSGVRTGDSGLGSFAGLLKGWGWGVGSTSPHSPPTLTTSLLRRPCPGDPLRPVPTAGILVFAAPSTLLRVGILLPPRGPSPCLTKVQICPPLPLVSRCVVEGTTLCVSLVFLLSLAKVSHLGVLPSTSFSFDKLWYFWSHRPETPVSPGPETPVSP